MVRERSKSKACQSGQEHVLVIGPLPFKPQKDRAGGSISWRPVKDLVRCFLTRGAGEDPNVKIIDDWSPEYSAWAFVRLRKEENARSAFNNIAGNSWYGSILTTRWLSVSAQHGKIGPPRELERRNNRQNPIKLESISQIRDARLLQPTGQALRQVSTQRGGTSGYSGPNHHRDQSVIGSRQPRTRPALPNIATTHASAFNTGLQSGPYSPSTPYADALCNNSWSGDNVAGQQLPPLVNGFLFNQQAMQQWISTVQTPTILGYSTYSHGHEPLVYMPENYQVLPVSATSGYVVPVPIAVPISTTGRSILGGKAKTIEPRKHAEAGSNEKDKNISGVMEKKDKDKYVGPIIVDGSRRASMKST